MAFDISHESHKKPVDLIEKFYVAIDMGSGLHSRARLDWQSLWSMTCLKPLESHPQIDSTFLGI